MMAHNFPEGLASGGSLVQQGSSVLVAIIIQNIPEGLTTGLSFISLGLNPISAFFGVVATSLVEIIGGLIGGALSSYLQHSLPIMMTFAGGAMFSISLIELIDRVGEESAWVFMKPSFLSGVLIMMITSNV